MPYRPRGLTFDEFEAGASYVTPSRTITEADIVAFAGLSGDFNPLHTDESFARGTPFGGRIAHGALVLSVATGLANQTGIWEGTTLALLEMTTKFTGAVRPGDTIRLEQKVLEKKETSKPDRGVLSVECRVINQKDETVLDGIWKVLMSRKKGEQP